ncbi:tRNA (adenosine(37)-N6)-dimethylallyltransferase MiaA [Carboxylicivirga linearis]|uniref:tRNA dimethylallyltransferase n=1 Tax=Carboxylicivirga linearis TaxID=1628157 RepID=A0ABS5K2X4_9BACT|nr:tRNA (adenosine(37)-N6)-dimethylallyltransferase MiaA [Carboxylicivirga linearis]MBS2100996.1 tRNA (adenosine(37)-N6)-dimethylallyltransferase MiaA [Carboxylicivirga linearis]
MTKHLVVLVGPTGIGKTDTSLKIAKHFDTEIISADSRQIYKELKIGTAAPTQEQLAIIPHHMVATHSVNDYYNAWQFEQDVLKLSDELFKKHDAIVLTGGSMMYVDAVTKGIDDLPTIDPDLRQEVMDIYEKDGLDAIRRQLKILDPEFYNQVDLKNHKRVMHAVEVCLMTGKPYSSLRTNTNRQRPFNIIKLGLDMDREELYNRINLRVDQMVKDGLFEEAKQFYHLKEINALNTVGYKEIFAHWDGEYDATTAIELIKRNSRRYAKRQLSWFRRDKEMHWFNPKDADEMITFVEQQIFV